MNLLARILSHGFALAIVAILAVGYIYRGDLFPGMELPAFLYPDTPAQTGSKEATADAGREEPAPEPERAPEPAVVTTAPAPAGEGPLATREQGLADTATEPAAASEPETPEEPPAETAAEEPAAMIDASEPSAPPVAAVETLQQDTPVPAEDMPIEPEVSIDVPAPREVPEAVPAVTADAAGEPVSATDSKPQETVSGEESGPAVEIEPSIPATAAAGTTSPAAREDTGKPYQLLATARESFWKHNYAEAETKYRDLIALEPDNPDGYGELGNMYFTRGDWEQAAEAYFNAGKRLVQSGHIQQAGMLVEVIRGLNGSQADELEALINAASDTGR
jgi:hypothetical protein